LVPEKVINLNRYHYNSENTRDILVRS